MVSDKKFIYILSILFISCLVIIISLSFSKYFSSKSTGTIVNPEKYYFTIDLLGDTNTSESLNKEYDLYGGDSKSIPFVIKNYFDELRISPSNINYFVSIEEGNEFANVNLTGDGILNGGILDSENCLVLINAGYSNDTRITVKISSTSPYTKTMRITFILHTYESNVQALINDSDKSLTAELVISTNVNIENKCLIIDYSNINKTTNNLQVDLTNYYLLDDGSQIITNKLNVGESFLKSVTLTKSLHSGEALSILFFKSNISIDYSSLTISISSTIIDENVVYTIKLSESGGI